MNKKIYKLNVTKNKLLIKEDVSQTVTTKQVTKAVTDPISKTASMSLNVINDVANMTTYVISAILTMFSSEEVKKRVEERYKNRRRSIFSKYNEISKSLELNTGSEEALFLFSPSLFIYEKTTEGLKSKGGIVGENLSDFLDDPLTYVIEVLPKLKASIMGDKKELKKELEIDDSKMKSIVRNIQKFGIENLKKMSEDKTLKYEQRQAIKSILKFIEKNKSLLKNNHVILKINKKIIIENEENKNIKELLNAFSKEKDEILKKAISQIINEDDIKEELKDIKEDTTKVILNAEGISGISMYLLLLLEELKDIVQNNLENDIQKLETFKERNKIQILDANTKKVFEDQYDEILDKLIESLLKAKSINDLKLIIVNSEIINLIKDFVDLIQKELAFLRAKPIESFTELPDNIKLKEKKEKIEKTFENLITSYKGIVNFLNSVQPKDKE